jgi:hypothetical protein
MDSALFFCSTHYQRGATLHQSITHPVRGLHIELLLGLDRHKAHVLFAHAFGDGLGIEEVVLVGLAIRLHKLSRDESHLVTLLAQGGPQEVRSRTGFQTDQ